MLDGLGRDRERHSGVPCSLAAEPVAGTDGDAGFGSEPPRDLGDIEFYEDGTTTELVAGDLYVLRYKVVRDFLAEGSVALV